MKFLLNIFALFLLFVANLQANDNVLNKIEQQLNGLTSGVLVFTQEDNYGNKDNGLILFNKPGKARIEYVLSPITIIANASSLVAYNKQDKTKSYIPSSKVPIFSILAQKNLDFKNGLFNVDNFQTTNDSYVVKLSTKDENLGSLTMVFDKVSLNIKSWSYQSFDNSQNIKVTILNQINKKLTNSIFNVNRIEEISIKDYK